MKSSLVLLLLLLPLLAFGAPKKSKKKSAPKPAVPTAADLAIRAALDGAEQQVGGCVLEYVPGDFTLVVLAKLSLNTAGQLLGATLAFTPEQENAEKLRACIDGVLHGITFPRTTGALVQAEREWKFSTETK